MYNLELIKRGKSRFVSVPERTHYNVTFDDGVWVNGPSIMYTAGEYAAIWPTKAFRFNKDGTVTYRSGKLTIEFDASGKPIEGWSYWTCIFCFSEPTEDFPQGRLIYNDSGYGSTTGGHIGVMRPFFEGDVVGSRVSTYRYRERNENGEMEWRSISQEVDINANDATMADQICWGRGTSPSDMRRELITMDRHVSIAERNKRYRALRIEAEAQVAAEAESAREPELA